jgi:TRAP-type C4-dicarboxylate transport system substrate-binding protein
VLLKVSGELIISFSIYSLIQVTKMGINSKFVIAILITILHAVHGSEVIKMGTFTPQSSPWGQVLTVWTQAVSEKSGGRLELQWFYNGQQGDEATMVTKMKSGQLDGALITAVGLGRIYIPILALQMPGLFKTWSKLDTARQAMNSDFEKGLTDAGFSLFNWTDFGAAHLFSKGLTVRIPGDVKGKKPFIDRNNPIESVLYQVIGGVTPVPLNIPEVLPQLNVGAINIVNAPSLVAEQLQWSSKLDTINKDVNVLVTGGLIISAKRLNALPVDLRTILLDTGKVAANSLIKRIQDADDTAFSRIQSKMNIVTLTADELAQWNTIYKEVRRRLAQGTFSLNLVAKLEQLAN